MGDRKLDTLRLELFPNSPESRRGDLAIGFSHHVGRQHGVSGIKGRNIYPRADLTHVSSIVSAVEADGFGGIMVAVDWGLAGQYALSQDGQ